MDWKKLELLDKELFSQYTKSKNYCISDINFTNLYMWSFTREISYKIIDGFLCIKTKYPNQEPFLFMPLGDGDILGVIETLKKEISPFKLRAITPRMTLTLGDGFIYEPERDRFDYVYSIEELIELKGRKFHSKKNHLNRFLELYAFEYEPITADNASEVLEVYRKWYGSLNETARETLKNEKIAIREALNVFDKLDSRGALLRVDGEIVAFTFGEQLNDDTVVVHIEKANIKFHGAYQAINQQFLEHEWKHLKYVNREEDLGLEGLRRAKLSYNPVMFIEKYSAIARQYQGLS